MRSISLNTALAISVRLFIGLTGASLRCFRCVYCSLQLLQSHVLHVGFDKLKNLSNQDLFYTFSTKHPIINPLLNSYSISRKDYD